MLLDQHHICCSSGFSLHDGFGACLACAEGDGLSDETGGGRRPAIFVRPVF